MRWTNYFLSGMLLFFCIAFFTVESIAEEFSVKSTFTFNEALNRAQSNDEEDKIYLLPGTYYVFELLTYWAKQDISGQPPHVETYSLTIEGDNYQNTIMEGSDNGILLIDTLAVPEEILITITIKNITFKNAKKGRGLSIVGKAASIRVENCAFIDNKGGVELLNTTGDISIANCSFNGNSGAYQGSGALVNSKAGRLLSLERNTFIRNVDAREGGGLYCVIGGEASVTVSNNVFKDNHAIGSGGGLALIAMNGGKIHLAQNTFENNRVGLDGGGAYLLSGDQKQTASITLAKNTFTGNMAAEHGGGAYVFANRGQLGVSHAMFKQNQASSNGGALYSEIKTSSALFINSIIAENKALKGAGIYGKTDTGEILLINTTCAYNEAYAWGEGGGVYAELWDNRARTSIYNTILWHNTAGTQSDDVCINDDGNGDGAGAFVEFQHSVYERLTVKDGDNMTAAPTIAADPALASDYHLLSGSPCIDTGSNTAPQIPDKDMDFDDRIIDGDGDGEAIVDIGADEYDPTTPPTTTTTTTISPPVCMIQTIYGEQAEAVTTLRRLRDEGIAKIPAGHALIALYYRLSAVMAETVQHNALARREIKWVVDNIVWMVNLLGRPPKMKGETGCAQRQNANP